MPETEPKRQADEVQVLKQKLQLKLLTFWKPPPLKEESSLSYGSS